jgi:hypothetical protein
MIMIHSARRFYRAGSQQGRLNQAVFFLEAAFSGMTSLPSEDCLYLHAVMLLNTRIQNFE